MTNKKYPPQKPYEPIKPKDFTYRLTKAKGGKVIYRDVRPLEDCEQEVVEYFEDHDEILPEPKIKSWHSLSLQDIIDLAPPGAKLSDIILKVDLPRYCNFIDISFTHYKRDLKAEEKEYIKDLNKYEKELYKYEQDMIQYEKELAEYNSWKKDQEIKELKYKLNKLENSR